MPLDKITHASLGRSDIQRGDGSDDDSYVVHSFERHVSNLQGAVSSDSGPYSATPKHERHRA
jgi:hypothetical protein